MNTFVNLVLRNWKTTVTGLLGATIACILAIMLLPPGASKLVVALAICRALVDFIKRDAGTVMAVTAANPVPHPEPAHEIPDDPKAIPAKSASDK